MTDIAPAVVDWQPIGTMPFGQRVMPFFSQGVKGNVWADPGPLVEAAFRVLSEAAR